MSAAGRAWLRAGLLCALVVLADQAAKAAIEHNLFPGQQVEVLGPLELTLSHNRGVAFGLAGGAGAPLIVFTLVALGFVVSIFARDPLRRGMWIAGGLVVGGALGNLIDRVRAGEVTDFVDVASWPPFNLADVAITFGVGLLVLILLRETEGEQAEGEPRGG
ncbi:MAG TPA: signal peptidase II [Solirubrobacterales bacterium]|nr:signal peptidase II [Solirubrobacterales bacterium]